MPLARATIPLLPLGCGGTGRIPVERALLAVPGVLKAYVNPVTETAYVEYDPTQCGETRIRAAVARTGFGLGEPTLQPAPHADRGGRRLEPRGLALATGILLASAFALTAWPRLLAPSAGQGRDICTLLLPGLDLSRWTGFAIGLATIFAYGLAGGWLLATVYGIVADRRSPRRGVVHRTAAAPNAPGKGSAPREGTPQ